MENEGAVHLTQCAVARCNGERNVASLTQACNFFIYVYINVGLCFRATAFRMLE
jgi:hypothetical protein